MPTPQPAHASDLASAFIGAAITPALLFTACALLLSGLQGKYSTLVNAIRNLNTERRGLARETAAGAPEWADARRTNIGQQIEALIERAQLVRNSLFCLYSAIFLFLVASLCGGVSALGFGAAAFGALGCFAAGMIFVVTAMVFGFREARRSFEIIRLETEMGEIWDRAHSSEISETEADDEAEG